MTGSDPRLELVLGPVQNLRLFSDHFLSVRLPEWPEFRDASVDALFDHLRELWQAERAGLASANEAQTEERFVKPVLRALGYSYTVQAGVPFASGRRQPDYALFLDDERRAEADGLSGTARFEHAVAVADAKRFDRPLNRRRVAGALSEDPVAQIIQYVSITRRRWGMLTNGRLWRLYGAAGNLIEGACLEIDLGALLERGDSAAFRYFAFFFGASSLRPDGSGVALLDRAHEQSRAHAVEVGGQLERQVFAAVPLIAEGLLEGHEHDREALDEAFDHALVLLYRLLFCLHAEARGLLPVDNPHYARYSVGARRASLARDLDSSRVFSSASDDLYNDLRALFRIVDRGDPALRVNEYDGGLFSATRYPYFTGRSVPDSTLAPALDHLYRVGGKSVDYRDLSIRHLGTIYERLLAFRLESEGEGLRLVSDPRRHDTGSYFTPSHVVDSIVERTLDPLLRERSAAIAQAGATGPAALEAFLGLRVLDPAMGSAHFLVAVATYIAQFVATDPSYDGDLSLLEIQRLVAERCLYGVDLNPLAVELGQLSLWLATVRGDEPLTFLNNLRVGDSLVGARLGELLEGGGTVFASALARDADRMLAGVAQIAERSSRSGADVHEKERLALAVEALREPLEAHADEAIGPAFPTERPPFFHWELEFPEVFLGEEGRGRPDGGFDAVVGNPPYVQIQDLGREMADYCRSRYDTASGSFDVYVPFVERAVSLLKDSGRLGFIIPSRMLKLNYASKLRDALTRKRLIEEVIDFGDAQLFEGATNYTCVLVLNKRGVREFAYRQVRGSAAEVRRRLVNVDRLPTERFVSDGFGADPWRLATGETARILRAVATGASPLEAVTDQIFQGLITSADRVFVLEDRGATAGRQRVFSRASGKELELETDQVRPLASGRHVERYGFKALGQVLLFPYRQVPGGAMRLLSAEELAALPHTAAYLREHEAVLRGRERNKMDHDDWYGYVYPKNLGAHDRPKLGVPRMCARLRASLDLAGEVYLDNVDVNGVLPASDSVSPSYLTALLNSRLLDFVFRRGSVPFRGAYWSANKQFIASLPIRCEEDGALDRMGRDLHRLSLAVAEESGGFLSWLEGLLETRVGSLRGSTRLAGYETHDASTLLSTLTVNRTLLARDPEARTFRELFRRELAASHDRLRPLRSEIATIERRADEAIYDLYELDYSQRTLVDAEYS